jgi:hypothetical protein
MAYQIKDLDDTFPDGSALEYFFDGHALNVACLDAVKLSYYILRSMWLILPPLASRPSSRSSWLPRRPSLACSVLHPIPHPGRYIVHKGRCRRVVALPNLERWD